MRRKMSPPLKPKGSNLRRRRSIIRWNSPEMICIDLRHQRSWTSWKRQTVCSTAASLKCRWDCSDENTKASLSQTCTRLMHLDVFWRFNRWTSCWKRLSSVIVETSKSASSFRPSPSCSRTCRCHQQSRCVLLWLVNHHSTQNHLLFYYLCLFNHSCYKVFPCVQVNDLSWLSGAVKVPFLLTPKTTKGKFHMAPPASIDLIGSYPLGTCIKPNIKVDLAVTIPAVSHHLKPYGEVRCCHLLTVVWWNVN